MCLVVSRETLIEPQYARLFHVKRGQTRSRRHFGRKKRMFHVKHSVKERTRSFCRVLGRLFRVKQVRRYIQTSFAAHRSFSGVCGSLPCAALPSPCCRRRPTPLFWLSARPFTRRLPKMKNFMKFARRD